MEAPKKAEPSDLKTMLLGLLSTLIVSALSFVLGLPPDRRYLWISIGCILPPALFVLFGRRKTADSALIGLDERPLKTTPVRRIWLWVLAMVAILSLVQLIVVALCFWNSLFPIAGIDRFEGSEIVWWHDDLFLHHGAVPIRFSDGRDGEAYPAFSFEISKASHLSQIRIDSVKVVGGPVDVQILRKAGLYPENMVKPITFRAKLSRASHVCEAGLEAEGRIVPGVIFFDEDHSFGLIRVEFNTDEREDTVYLVTIEVLVKDEEGTRRRTLSPGREIYVYVPGKNWDEAP
jgi:hypothetical protein